MSIVRPLRVIIDLAISRIREEDETDEEWNEDVRLENEVHRIGLMLHQHQFRDRTPPSPVD